MWLHFDCFSGISGDMTLGALIDLGVPIEYLAEQLQLLNLDGFSVSARRQMIGVLDAVHFDVQLAPQPSSPSHSHPHSHGHLGGYEHQEGLHRTYSEIKELIEASLLTPAVKEKALNIFARLAEAEGAVHGVPPEEVHFHEVGALDSIVDIVGTAIALDYLKITRLTSSPLPLSRGFFISQHGRLPLPAPATLELLRGVPITDSQLDKELVTPTGAAIVATLADDFLSFPSFTLQAVGYGSGTRTLPDRPNVLRALLGQETTSTTNPLLQIEVNLDDLSPEILAFAMEKLLLAGAKDVWLTPIQMKKGRPAQKLALLCEKKLLPQIEKILLQETSTFGFRYFPVERRILEREYRKISTEYGPISIKIGMKKGEILTIAPEFEECKRIANEQNIPLKKVYEAALRSWKNSEKEK